MRLNSSVPMAFDAPQAIVEHLIYNVEKVIVGKREAIEKSVIALLCDGHVLLEDVPGVGKTMLVRTLAKSIGGAFRRIQFTPDLLPSDVTGVSVYQQKTQEFTFRPGPIMANIVLADELNRASPKTQAALLEAMEERSVTVDGQSHSLPQPFLLLATQNPVEQEGAFVLPEAQLDRFLMKIRLGYPREEEEAKLLDRVQDKHPVDNVKPVLLPEELIRLQRQVASVYVDDSLKKYIVRLAAATREHPDLLLGASPRASISLMRTAQGQAFVRGRSYAIPDDIKQMALPTLAHRLILRPDALWLDKSAENIIRQIIGETPVPALGYAPTKPAIG